MKVNFKSEKHFYFTFRRLQGDLQALTVTYRMKISAVRLGYIIIGFVPSIEMNFYMIGGSDFGNCSYANHCRELSVLNFQFHANFPTNRYGSWNWKDNA